MLATWPTSPVTEALAKVLELFHPGAIALKKPESGKQYLVLSYHDDFKCLWNFWEEKVTQDKDLEVDEQSHLDVEETTPVSESDHLGLPDGDIIRWMRSKNTDSKEDKSLIIVWDGIPEPRVVSNINLANYVTPYDWVIALCLALHGREESPNVARKPSARVLILDLTTSETAAPESARLFRQLQYGPWPLLEWVQLYRHSSSLGPEGAIEHLLQDLCYSAPKESNIVKVSSKQDTFGDLTSSVLKQILAARLLAPANPRDRHAIANLVGLQILLSAMSPKLAQSSGSASFCLSALVTLMRATKLIPSNQEQFESPWIDIDQYEIFKKKNNNSVFVLLDDLHELGWADFLRLALGLDQDDSRLAAFGEPETRKFGPKGNSSLLDLLKDDKGQLRVRKGIELCPGGRNAILFLDLRLFNMRTVKEEMDFFKSLLILAEQVKDDDGGREGLPWRGFTSHELQAITNCISQERVESDEYFIALTLLPRLIALVDPMLPVILFSSTGQRRITESLKGYDSVITEFAKPRFWGETSGDIVGETRSRFERAFTQALHLLRGRNVCQQLLVSHVAGLNDTREPYVEIYIDEADEVSETTFRVGGIVMLFEDENKADIFNKWMLNHSLVWGPTDINPNPQRDILPKEGLTWEEYQTMVFGPVHQFLQQAGAQEAIGFCLMCPQEVLWRDSSDLTSPWCLDNLYRTMTLQALEVLLYEVIPNNLKNKLPRFKGGVYVATRARAQSDADSPSEWPKLVSRYGVHMIKLENGEGFVSVGSDSVYPIVAQVQALNPPASFRIVAARGGKLRYGGGRQGLYDRELPRPAHYLADFVVRFANNPRALKKQSALQRWLDHGFTATVDDRFLFSLHACRSARAGRHVEAVLDAYKASWDSGSKTELDRWAKQRISQSVRALSGRNFVELCRRLPIESLRNLA